MSPDFRDNLPNNLPAHLTLFVGRQAELATLHDMLLNPGCRLLTITGPGGMGKTRLALEVADQFVKENHDLFTDGVFWVPLADLNDTDSFVSSVADAVGFRFLMTRKPLAQQLAEFLRPKKMLLVLDNFEHLLGDLSLRFVIDVLAAAPGIKALVTSRIRLDIRGEQGFPIFGLNVTCPISHVQGANEDTDSVKLFADVAHRAHPAFVLDSTTRSSVIDICRMVEGMPLAIELAAAWTALLEPTEIMEEIHTSLDFLTSDAVDIPARHRSLPVVFTASWQLLNESERDVLSGLSVFRGGFTCDAARVVTGVSPQTLLGLLRKSWLQARKDWALPHACLAAAICRRKVGEGC